MQPPSAEQTAVPDHSGGPSPDKIGRYEILGPSGPAGWARCIKPMTRISSARYRSRCPGSTRFPTTERCDWMLPARGSLRCPGLGTLDVCPIYDVGVHDGQPYVVMAYVEGQSLAERLVQHGALTTSAPPSS